MERSTAAASVAAGTLTRRSAFVQAAWIVGFAALTAVGAQIEIPVVPVPITLQTFIVLLSGAVLGMRGGAISQILYLLAGIAGLPVFAGWAAGPALLLGPTGGYLLAFPVAAFITGWCVGERKGFGWYLAGTLAGSLVIFLMGMTQLKIVYTHNWTDAFTSGVLIFSLWDAVKVVGAAAIAHSLRRMIR